MATAFARACPVFGCDQVQPCPRHRPAPRLLSADQVERHRFYRRQPWRRARALFLLKHPFCAHCEAEGRLVAAKEVHHLERLAVTDRPYDFSNLQALCRMHHARVTNAESRGGRVEP